MKLKSFSIQIIFVCILCSENLQVSINGQPTLKSSEEHVQIDHVFKKTCERWFQQKKALLVFQGSYYSISIRKNSHDRPPLILQPRNAAYNPYGRASIETPPCCDCTHNSGITALVPFDDKECLSERSRVWHRCYPSTRGRP